MYATKSCLECGKEHRNPKFCSNSCSVTNSNKNKHQRFLKNKCKGCSIPLYASRSYCTSCWGKQQNNDMTLEQAEAGRKDANRYMKIRSRARMIAKQSNLLNECKNCKYNKHVEVCHIRDIASFSKDTLLSVINSLDNLICLCPNCHWELDNGLLVLN